MTDLALAGAGTMAAVHGLAIASMSDARLVAVASRTEAGAAALASDTGARVVRPDELPAGAAAVVVATPPSRHARHALTAVAGGAAALVETPLCATLDDADRLVRVAESGGALVYAENLLHAPAVRVARRHIADLGPLTALTARVDQPVAPGRLAAGRSWGGGVLFDIGVHPLAVVALSAAPARPVAVEATFAESPVGGVEDAAVVTIAFDSGLRARLEVTGFPPSGPSPDGPRTASWDLQAASDTGTVVLSLAPEIVVERNGEAVPVPGPEDDPLVPEGLSQVRAFGYLAQLEAMRRGLEAAGAGPEEATMAFGRSMLEIICAAASSARSGAPCPLPFAGPRDRTPAELWHPGTPEPAN